MKTHPLLITSGFHPLSPCVSPFPPPHPHQALLSPGWTAALPFPSSPLQRRLVSPLTQLPQAPSSITQGSGGDEPAASGRQQSWAPQDLSAVLLHHSPAQQVWVTLSVLFHFSCAWIETLDEDEEKNTYILPVTDHSHNLGPRCSLPDLRRRVKSQTFSSLLHSLPGWLPHGPLFSLWWTAGATKQGRSRVDNRFLESLCIARCHRSSLGSLDRPAMPRLTAFQEALI